MAVNAGTTKIRGAPPRKCKGGNQGRSMNGRGHKATVRYWQTNRLETHKVRHIQRDYAKSGRTLSYAEAAALWHKSRKVAV